MKSLNNKNTWYQAGVCFFSALCLLSVYFTSMQGDVTLTTDINDRINIFWAEENHSFNVNKALDNYPISSQENRSIHSFSIDNLSKVAVIRIDPLRDKGQFNIFSLKISQPGYKTLLFDTQKKLSQLVPTNHLTNFQVTDDGVSAVSIGNDPMIILPFQPKLSYFWFITRFMASLAFAITALFVVKSFLKHKFLFFVGIFLINILVVGLLGINWWASKDNTLFQNGRWDIGKDTGKFVFQTYDFMSTPLSGSTISLANNMGFQEILYKNHDTANRRLAALSCAIYLGPQAYIWIELEKKGQQMLGVRLSLNKDYESGFFTYSADGELINKQLIRLPETPINVWSNLSLVRENGIWTLLLNDKKSGVHPIIGQSNSTFGFRGCTSGREMYLRDIEMKYVDPVTGKNWIEKEDFGPSSSKKRGTPWIFAIISLVLLVKLTRDETLASFLPSSETMKFRILTQSAILIPVSIALIFFSKDFIYSIPLCFLVAEIAVVVGFSLFYKPQNIDFISKKSMSILYVICILMVSGAAYFANDSMLQSSNIVLNENLSRINPDIYVTSPQGSPAKSSYVMIDPISITAGQPFFVPGIFRQQKIDLNFSLPEQTTLDIVFQQQSFLTRGDLEGEEIPLQRRLLRLSTKSGVVSGISTNTGVRSAPFVKLNGELLAHKDNNISISVTNSGIGLNLNGVITNFDQFVLLGFGETGFLTYENSVQLNSVSVVPTELKLVSGDRIYILLFLVPFLIAFLFYLFFRLAGPIPLYNTLILGLCSYYPIVVLLIASMLLSSEGLHFLSESWLGWFFILVTAFAINLFYLLIYTKRLIKFPAIYANLISILGLIAITGFVYIVLPSDNPIKLRFSKTTIAPGDIAHGEQKHKRAWYADNTLIGTNIWVWKQRFGGKQAIPGKNNDAVRIFVIGGSQAWGSGAGDSNSTFSKLLEKKLLAKGLPVQVLNAGTNSMGLYTITRSNKELLPIYEPDIIIIDVGTNDSGARRMLSGAKQQQKFVYDRLADFKSFVEFFQNRDVRIILNLEAMCAESYDMFFPDTELYDGLRKIAEEKGIQVVTPSAVTEQLEKDHPFWWDIAHLTPYGQNVMAELLLPATKQMVENVLSDKAPAK